MRQAVHVACTEGIQNFKQVTPPIICNDAEGNISQTDLILARWKDYFCKIHNTSEAIDTQNIIKECTNNLKSHYHHIMKYAL